jgi:hypothetical protein
VFCGLLLENIVSIKLVEGGQHLVEIVVDQ